jgi:signal peptidase I
MTPEIPVGSVVLIRPVDPAARHPGDVATYQVEEGEEVFITHRVTKVHASSKGLEFTFKGDANRGPDIDRIPAGAVRGEVWFHVPHLGAIRDALHGKGGVTLLAMLALAGYALSQISAGIRDRRDASRRSSLTFATTQVEIGRALVVATVPRDVADACGGLLVAEHGDDVTVVLAPAEEDRRLTVELLRERGARTVEVLEGPVVVTSTRTADTVPEVQHA